MTVFLRSLYAYALILILALTSQTMAVAQGQAAAVGELEICHGLGVISIPLDAEGNPTGPAVICPDFATAVALEGANLARVAAPIAAEYGVEFELGSSRAFGRVPLSGSARAPPVLG